MRSRLALAFLIAAGSCLAFTASASACPTANLVLSPGTGAGPGDTVAWSLSGIVPGADYTIGFAGQNVSGKNDTSFNGVSGTFTMPDLGSEQRMVDANGTCTCPEDASAQLIHDSIPYLPPAPAVPPGTGSSHGSSSTPQPAVPAHTSQQPKTSVTKHGPAASSSHPAAAPSAKDSGGGAVLGTKLAAPQPVNAPSDSAPRAKAKERTREASSGVPNRVLDTIGATTSVGPAKVPTLGLLAIALILIVGLGLAGLAIYIFRNGPDPDAAVRDPAPTGPDPIEAELQQIIAAEMARQLVSDLNLGEPDQGQLEVTPTASSQHLA
jgi:hypothetical protein